MVRPRDFETSGLRLRRGDALSSWASGRIMIGVALILLQGANKAITIGVRILKEITQDSKCLKPIKNRYKLFFFYCFGIQKPFSLLAV